MNTQSVAKLWRGWYALALGAALLCGTVAGPGSVAWGQDKQKNTVSKVAAKPLKAAQDLMNAKKYPEMIAKLKEVEALPGKNAYDEYLMHEMFGFAYARTKNYAEAVKHLEAGLESGFLDEAEVPNRVRQLAGVNYQIKNYGKAIQYGRRALENNYGDPEDVFVIVSQGYYLQNDCENTRKFAEEYVNAQIRRGQEPKEQTLQLILSACAKLDDADCQTRQFERLATYHPKPEYWQNLMYSVVQAPDHNDRTLLHTFRLMSEVDVLKRPEDYTEMAQLAIEQGSPGEAQAILEKGFEKNVFVEQRDQDRNRRLLESAKKQAEADKATLAQADADAAASPTGTKDIGVGLAYLSYGQYDKAVQVLERGIKKGGLKNEAEARLLLGIAQLNAGMKAEAQKTFQTVKGDPKFERLASLWGLHAKQA